MLLWTAHHHVSLPFLGDLCITINVYCLWVIQGHRWDHIDVIYWSVTELRHRYKIRRTSCICFISAKVVFPSFKWSYTHAYRCFTSPPHVLSQAMTDFWHNTSNMLGQKFIKQISSNALTASFPVCLLPRSALDHKLFINKSPCKLHFEDYTAAEEIKCYSFTDSPIAAATVTSWQLP